MLRNINFDDLKNLDPEQVNKVISESGLIFPPYQNKKEKTNKKMFYNHQHSNSQEYKDLGFLHKEKR